MKSKSELTESYSDYLLEHGERPKTVHHFAHTLNIEEAEFYKYFAGFPAIESSIFESFFENALSLTLKEKEAGLDVHNELLTFYFTFFEVLKSNRSLVLILLKKRPLILNRKALSGLRDAFLQYIQSMNLPLGLLDKIERKELDKIKEKGKGEAAWLQLMSFLDFWLHDDSPSFEKTDAFIEKSVKVGFSLVQNPLFEELFDLGKFFIKERLKAF
ncbi:MAG: TetR family transcriptional regulator C-terminal domain-containing protein [Chitinophagaceae bacterium]